MKHLDHEDHDTLLYAAKALGHMAQLAQARAEPTPQFIAEAAHYTAELADLAMRVQWTLEETQTQNENATTGANGDGANNEDFSRGYEVKPHDE